MLATHDSMRIPRLSEGAFHSWRAVELTSRELHYLLTIANPPSSVELDILFNLDVEVVSFLAAQTEATPVALHVLVPNGWKGARGWQILPAVQLAVCQVPDDGESLVVLRFANGATVRARDLAPVASNDTRTVVIAEFC